MSLGIRFKFELIITPKINKCNRNLKNSTMIVFLYYNRFVVNEARKD